MSQKGIYNLQTSSLLCTEMEDEARGEMRREGKLAEQYVRGEETETSVSSE